MRYEGVVDRPPSEAHSLITQATLACPHNRCGFCSMYKGRKLRVRPTEEIFEDLDLALRAYGKHGVHTTFLADGNTAVMPTEKLVAIGEAARAQFPELRRITMYGSARFLVKKSREEWKRVAGAVARRATAWPVRLAVAVLLPILAGTLALPPEATASRFTEACRGLGRIDRPRVFPAARSPYRGRPKIAKGKFLVASRQLLDPNFFTTVVLLLHYDASGAMGVVINRRTKVRASTVLPGVRELHGRPDAVYLGGPVSHDQMLLLIRAAHEPESSLPVFDGVYVTSNLKTLRKELGREESSVRAYVGHAGWAAGQLDREVAGGYWHVTSADVRSVFEKPPSQVWPELIRRVEDLWMALSAGLPPLPRGERWLVPSCRTNPRPHRSGDPCGR